VERSGPRMFCVLTGLNAIGVLNRKQGSLTAKWPLPPEDKHPVSLGLDEANHRLFVTTREPAKLVRSQFRYRERRRGASVCAPGRRSLFRPDPQANLSRGRWISCCLPPRRSGSLHSNEQSPEQFPGQDWIARAGMESLLLGRSSSCPAAGGGPDI
jgi:hypothetical protein